MECPHRGSDASEGGTNRGGLHTLANNTRLLILPWVRVPPPASHVLGAAARRIGADWHAKYGHGLDILETFVGGDHFGSTCYRAANWQCVGQTQGRSRKDRNRTCPLLRKDIYLTRVDLDLRMTRALPI